MKSIALAYRLLLFAIASAVATLTLAGPVGCTPVTATEALQIADQWLAADINSSRSGVPESERSDRLAALRNREVLYLLSTDKLSTKPEDGQEVLAYVVKYLGGGYVVVSADDRMEPVQAFDLESEFRWENVSQNYMRTFLSGKMPALSSQIKAAEAQGTVLATHAGWSTVRARLRSGVALDRVSSDEPAEPAGTVLLRWRTALWDQGTYYNDVVTTHNGGIQGIATGCNSIANAIKYRFHEWPTTGSGTHSYCDTSGAVQYCHSVNYGTSTYNWSQMPLTQLTGPNLEVATLIYHTGVQCGSNYEVGGTGGMTYPEEINAHFRYKGTLWTNSTEGHEAPVVASIRMGLPSLTCNPGHIFVACGYRDDYPTTYYYLNMGWNGGSNGWYSIDNYPGGPGFNGSWTYSCPTSYMYVDGAFTGTSNGYPQKPYKTISSGEAMVPSGGRLWIKGGTYTGTGNSPLRFDAPMTITAFQGAASIAGSLSLNSREADNITYANLPAIKMYANGVIKSY